MGKHTSVKRKFLTVENYGMGGDWHSIYARSAAEIKAKFPQLIVYDYSELPDWITPEWLKHLESRDVYDIDDEPTYYFKALLDESKKTQNK